MNCHNTSVENESDESAYSSDTSDTKSFDESSESEKSSVEESVDPGKLYWREKIEIAIAGYKDTTVGDILTKCFAQDFVNESFSRKRSFDSTIMTREESMKIGSILHEHIADFYCANRNEDIFDIKATNQLVEDMLCALQEPHAEEVKYDPRLNQELTQFYRFVTNNFLVLDDVDMFVMDKTHNVRGICNAIFRADSEDTRNVMLYDWTWSPLMQPDSPSLQRKTLQLNIYKNILEKFHDKKVVEMHSVVFHKSQQNYVDHRIEDLHFECPCAVCQIKVEKCF